MARTKRHGRRDRQLAAGLAVGAEARRQVRVIGPCLDRHVQSRISTSTTSSRLSRRIHETDTLSAAPRRTVDRRRISFDDDVVERELAGRQER